MSQILVEESALESIKAMAQRLQQERDELLYLLNAVNESAVRIGTSQEFAVAQWVIQKVQTAVDRCTTTPKVME